MKEQTKPAPLEVIGYFTKGPIKYMLTKVDDNMLVGFEITRFGKVHTMHIGRSQVDELVLLDNDVPAARAKDQEAIRELSGRLEKGRDYLMGTRPDEVTIEDALEAFGYQRNGL